MTPAVYVRAIVPIGVMFSLSLICGNLAYLYLSVSFIQMLKATTPVAVLLATWAAGMAPPDMRTLGNVSIIVVGVIIASFGEIQFVLIGFLIQLGGIVFEAARLTLVQRLLSSAEFKMDPLVSLYYFAPACTLMNAVIALVFEFPKLTMQDIHNVGMFVFLLNAMVAFMLNVSVVFLVSSVHLVCGLLKLTLSADWQDLLPRPHPLWRAQGYPARHGLSRHLPRPSLGTADLWLLHCSGRIDVLQAGRRQVQRVRRGCHQPGQRLHGIAILGIRRYGKELVVAAGKGKCRTCL